MGILAECPYCHRKQANKNKLCRSCGENLDNAKSSKKVKYWINYRLPNGKQKRESVGSFVDLNGYSIEDARIANAKRTVQKVEKRMMDVKPDYKDTFQDLSDWYLKLEKVKAKAYFKILKINLNNFNAVFGNMIVGKIMPVDLENYQAMRKAKGLSDSYIDQEIGAARTMINKAFDNNMVDGDALRTFKKVKKLLKRNANARNRVLSQDEFQGLIDKLPRHTKGIVAMGYYTGMRKGEILSLTWDKIDLKYRVISLEASDTKDGEPRKIPICDELHEILENIPRAIHTKFVFLYRGKPINDIIYAIKEACDASGLPYGRKIKNGFTFHDLRHTFNTNMRKAGVAESVIMEITGHSTREMFDRYNTIDDDDTRQAVDQMQAFLRNVDHSVDQQENII